MLHQIFIGVLYTITSYIKKTKRESTNVCLLSSSQVKVETLVAVYFEQNVIPFSLMKLVMKSQIVETFGYHFCKHIVYMENITVLNNKIVD